MKNSSRSEDIIAHALIVPLGNSYSASRQPLEQGTDIERQSITDGVD